MLLRADAAALPLRDESVQAICTSPPYWSLRKYEGMQERVWPALSEAEGGGERGCAHEWAEETDDAEGYTSRKRWQHSATRDGNPGAWSRSIRQHATCLRCGARRGALDLEPTKALTAVNEKGQGVFALDWPVKQIAREEG